MLAWVPQPVLAVCLLFPVTKANVAFKMKQAEDIEKKKEGHVISSKLFYLTQLDGLGNACGTIATLHSLANVLTEKELEADSPLGAFLKDTKTLSPKERGHALLKAKGIRKVSESTATSAVASTKCPERSARLNAHFVSFVLVEGCVYELDGRKKFPINHGASTEKTFLKDSVSVVKEKFMRLDQDNLNFNLMALTRSGG